MGTVKQAREREMRVHLSVGSNSGDRSAALGAVIEALDQHEQIVVEAVSHQYETEPWGEPEQPEFLNTAVEIETDLDPLEFLNIAKGVELDLGRVPGERWGPRVVDIDIILWGGTVLDTSELTVPHQAFRRRAFVLAPLAEIAGDTVDPVTGKSVSELAASPEAAGRVRRRNS